MKTELTDKCHACGSDVWLHSDTEEGTSYMTPRQSPQSQGEDAEETVVKEGSMIGAYLKGLEDGRAVDKQETFEFSEWTGMRGYTFYKLYNGWKHFRDGHQNGVYKTTSELFSLYQQEQQSKATKQYSIEPIKGETK